MDLLRENHLREEKEIMYIERAGMEQIKSKLVLFEENEFSRWVNTWLSGRVFILFYFSCWKKGRTFRSSPGRISINQWPLKGPAPIETYGAARFQFSLLQLQLKVYVVSRVGRKGDWLRGRQNWDEMNCIGWLTVREWSADDRWFIYKFEVKGRG